MSAEKRTPARELTMQDRMLAAAHMESIVFKDHTFRAIADTVIDCIRCCDYFPECAHVVDESERVDKQERRPRYYTGANNQRADADDREVTP